MEVNYKWSTPGVSTSPVLFYIFINHLDNEVECILNISEDKTKVSDVLKEPNRRTLMLSSDQSTSHVRRVWELGLYNLKKKKFRRNLINTWMENAKRTKPVSFQWCQCQDRRQWAWTGTKNFLSPSKHHKLLYCVDDRALMTVAQRGCGDTQKTMVLDTVF